MGYQEWFDQHALKHEAIVKRLRDQRMDQDAVIDYFDFENMCRHEPDFCPLYADHQKCHDMESLNCYLCACPNFRFKDAGIDSFEGNIRYSRCAIDSKEGKAAVFSKAIHQDCSACTVPHHRAYVQQKFQWSWRAIMAQTIL